jgi:hypothetical protein
VVLLREPWSQTSAEFSTRSCSCCWVLTCLPAETSRARQGPCRAAAGLTCTRALGTVLWHWRKVTVVVVAVTFGS